MNYYNPYYFTNPINYAETPGFFSKLFSQGSINLNSFLNGAQRTLSLINQAIPIIKEAAPMMRNARTMFKVMNEFKKVESPLNNNFSKDNTNDSIDSTKQEKYENNFDGPIFFV